MRMVWTALLLLVALPCLAGPQNLKESAALKPDEGLLITTSHCPENTFGMQLYAPGISAKGLIGPYRFKGVIVCNEPTTSLRIKAGRYYIGLLFYRQGQTFALDEADAPRITIEAGKATYIGDVYVVTGEPSQQDARRVMVHSLAFTDRRDDAQAVLERDYPWLLPRYPFVVSLPQNATIISTSSESQTSPP